MNKKKLLDRGEGERTRSGRPTVRTPSVLKVLFGAIERGLPYSQAAALAGISYDSVNRWRKQGLSPDAEPEICDFCKQLGIAKAKSADALLAKVNEAAAKGQWRAAAWMLERRYPEDWGRSKTTDDETNYF